MKTYKQRYEELREEHDVVILKLFKLRSAIADAIARMEDDDEGPGGWSNPVRSAYGFLHEVEDV